jgi:tetratricopeptide (TPR) repeat protein
MNIRQNNIAAISALGLVPVLFWIIAIYSNTFYASWHLDDRPNIVDNTYLHLESLEPQKIVNTLYTNPHNPEKLRKRPYRPVACLTFALNWYFGRDNVFGYHVVNLTIHLLTAYWLFLSVKMLFRTPRLKDECSGDPVRIASLTSVLWAVHPIHTQAVTYIVQRMALLAAFFYILGLYAYIRARLSQGRAKPMLWLAACTGFYFLGVFSKPNAAMLPLAIVLLEVVFFQDLADKRIRKAVFLFGSVVAILVLAIGSILFLKGDLLSILHHYDSRTFSLSERLMTQPRIILLYLSQMVFPLPARFSIAHDIVVSSSLIHPWTTLPSMAFILSLIGFSVLQAVKRPILSFAILFFFLNHIIESSVIGLELIFEHRNYLPSLFLFLPIAWGLDQLLSRYRKESKAVYTSIVFCIAAVVFFLSASTYIRNQVWKDDITLWMDAVEKAPNNARASNILAIKLAWGDHSRHPKRYDLALELFEKSLKMNLPRKDVKAGIHGNMASVYFYHKNNSQKAFQHFDEALKIDPGSLKIRRDFAEALMMHRDFESALEQINFLLDRKRDNGRYLNLKGHILLWLDRYEDALACFKDAYPLLGNKPNVLLNSAVALSLAGYHSNAENLLLESIEHFPAEMPFYYALIENSIRANDVDKGRIYAEKMSKLFTDREIEKGLKAFTDNPQFAPLHADPIRFVLNRISAPDVVDN